MSKHEKQARRARRKAEQQRWSSAATHGTAALAAAAAIAAGTSAYAEPIRFENPAGPRHFEWYGGDPAAGGFVLNVTSAAGDQSGEWDGPEFMRWGQFNQNPWLDGLSAGIYGTQAAANLQLGGAYDLFLVGVAEGQLIPSGLAWGEGGIVAYSGFGSELPEGLATYLGIQFPLEDGGPMHYGWIGVTRSGIELDALAWGYETEPGVAIPAGAPEPGSLALLAMGAVGVLSRRRR